MKKLLSGAMALALAATMFVTPVLAKEYWVKSDGLARSKIDVNGKEATFFTDHLFMGDENNHGKPPIWAKEYKITGFNSVEKDDRGIVTFYVDKGATFEGEPYLNNTLFSLLDDDSASGAENVVQTETTATFNGDVELMYGTGYNNGEGAYSVKIGNGNGLAVLVPFEGQAPRPQSQATTEQKAQPTPAAVLQPGSVNHTVEKGQSLTAIAAKYGVSAQAIKELNKAYFDNLAEVNKANKTNVTLEANVTLNIPLYNVVHTVAPKQSLSAIASKYGTNVTAIKALNKAYFDDLAARNKAQKTDVTLEAGAALTVQTKTPPPAPVDTSGATVKTVNTAALNVRAGASAGSGIIGALINGDTVFVLDVENGWAKIAYDGGSAYVDSNFLK